MTNKEVEVTHEKTVRQTFKAKIKTSKPHWTQKVISRRVKIVDGLDNSFCSFMTVYIPKMTYRQREPCIFCHVSNGNGSVLFRCKDPIELGSVLRTVADIVTSNEWTEKYEIMEDIHNGLEDCGELIADEDFIDIKGFNKAIEDGKVTQCLKS